MASIVPKKKESAPSKIQKIKTEDELEEEIENTPSNVVATHIYLKPHSNETLDREVVYRRIRHRKRVHNARKVFQALLSSPFSSKNDKAAVSAPRIKWVDDAFAAL